MGTRRERVKSGEGSQGNEGPRLQWLWKRMNGRGGQRGVDRQTLGCIGTLLSAAELQRVPSEKQISDS